MRPRVLAILLIASLLSPAVLAGTQEDPEIMDPADDAAVSRDCGDVPDNVCDVAAGGAASASGAADIVAVWITEPNATHYTIHVQTTAPGDDATAVSFTYNVTPTDISLYTGEDEHTVTFTVTGTTPGEDAPGNTTVARNAEDDAILEVTLTRADTGAVGGDAITGLTLTATHTSSDATPGDAVSWTDTTTDTAPDEGTGRQYNLTRPPIVADMELTAVGGHVTQTVNGTATTTSFTGSQANVLRGPSTVTYNLTLTNAGTDPDTATIEVFDPTGTLAAKNITASVQPTSTASLIPGESVAVTFTAQLDDPPGGEHILLVAVESGRGGADAEALTVQVPTPPPATPPPTPDPVDEEPEREAAAGLGFLSPAAEALGLDEAFGEWAELVLLALILLLLVLLIFLILFLVGRRSLTIDIEPRTIDAAPGETAEFTLSIRNRKKRDLDAVAQFDGDPAWSTAMVFGDAELAQPHTDARLGLGPKGAGSSTRVGKLRVRVPETAGEKETDEITLGVAALDAAGEPRRRREATVRVRAREGAVAEGLAMRLSSVDHEPAEPTVGDTVRTTARLENDSEDETLRLRVVLNLDGKDIQEQPVVLPPHSARAVVFRWEVPAGTSKIRVRVYPGE